MLVSLFGAQCLKHLIVVGKKNVGRVCSSLKGTTTTTTTTTKPLIPNKLG
jgi:hypothetical protein